jgi:hypothetical protein
MLVFESAGVTLLGAMISAVILATRRGRFDIDDRGSLPPSLDPDAEPDAPASAMAGHGHEHGAGGHDHGMDHP